MNIKNLSIDSGLKLSLFVLMLGISINTSNVHAQKSNEKFLAALGAINVDKIDKTPALIKPGIALGKKVYQASCASCHDVNLKGVPGQHVPDLSDKPVLYGSDNVDADFNQIFASDIETTVKYGIRADHANTRKLAFMPGYAGLDPKQEGGYPKLPDQDIADLTEFLISVRGENADTASAGRGKKLFANLGGCFDCHGPDADGNGAIGATDFTAKKNYLYGSDRASIIASIREGRKGMMPAYESKLSPAEIKAVSYYLMTVQRAAKN